MPEPAKSSKQTASKTNTAIKKTKKPLEAKTNKTARELPASTKVKPRALNDADLTHLIKIISHGENNIRQDLIAISQQVKQLSKEYHEFVDLAHKTPKRIFSRAYKAISNYWSIK